MLFLTLSRVHRAMEESDIASEILSSSFERSTFKSDYLQRSNERAKVQWFAKSEEIRRLLKLAADKFRDAEDKKTIDEMIEDHESTVKLFSDIVENRERTKSGSTSAELSQEIENRLVTQLNMRLYDKVLRTGRLREAAEQHLFAVLRMAGWSIFFVIAAVTAAATINSLTLGRTIINRIRLLRDGASIIGQGNLDHRIEIKLDDEFADLSHAFNTMTVKLQASYLELKNEIAERKRPEEALRESEERYRGLFENMIEGYAYCKMIFENGKPQDFIYLSVNHAFETLTGLKNVAGKRVTEVIPGIREADLELFEIYGRVSLTGKPERFEMFVEALKMWFSISVYSPEKEFFVAVFDVITERKRAEEALRDSEQRLRFHVENSPMAVVEWDANFNVTRWAGEAEKMFGWSAAETVGKPIMDLRMIYEEDIPIVNRTMERLTSGRERTVVSSNRNYTKSGAVIECVWNNSILLDGKGQMDSVLSLVEDITDRKRAEEDIKKLNKELKRNVDELAGANKELVAFVYSVSHDLRAPLRSITGFSDFLLQKYSGKLDDKGKIYLNWVINGAAKMNQIIDDLLHLSRISRQEIHRQDVDLSKAAGSIVAELRQSQPDRHVTIDIKEGITACADPGLIEVALSNLLRNAWKFTSKKENARIEFGAFTKDGKTVYYVKDNGAGFDPNFAYRLFLPFHRLHSEQEFEGSGSGLAIVERVIRRHGGKIWAEGKTGEGAAFFFTVT